MAKEFWEDDAPAETSVPAESGGDFWLSDKPAEQQGLPAGVAPSTAGAGRGSASVADYQAKADAQTRRPDPAPMARPQEDIDLTGDTQGFGSSAMASQMQQPPRRTSVLEGMDMQPGTPWTFGDASRAARRADDMQRRPEASITETPRATQIGMDARKVITNPVARGAVAGFAGLGQVIPGAIQAGADLVGADGVADAAGRVAKAGQQVSDPLRPEAGRDKLAFDITNSIVQTAPTLIVGLGGGPAMATLFGQSAAQEYTAGRSAGLDGGTAAARAGIMAGAEVVGERFGFGEQLQILKGLAGRVPVEELAPIFARQIMKEIPGEQLTTLVQFLGDKYGPGAQNPEAALADYLTQAGDTLKVTIGQSAVMGGGPVAISAARKQFTRPVDRSPQIEALRKTGDETAASLLEQRQQKEQAAYSTERETEALAQINPEIAQRYRDVRMAGAKTGDAVVQTAARWNFEQAAQMAGLTPKAQEAISNKLAEMPAEKAAGFVQKAIAGLVNAGQAQPFEGMDTLAQTIETQRDQMLDSVLATMNDIETLEQQDAQDPAQGAATTEAGPIDTVPATAVPDGADAVSGGNEPGSVPALSDLNDVIVTPDLDAVHAAATSPLNDLPEPTEAQKKAGNYKVGKIRMSGMDISIENPQGSERRGVDPDGKEWTTPMRDHYGYFKGTTAADGDKLDVFIKPGTPQDYDGQVFVVDQINPSTGKFDEAKVVFGATDQAEAEAIYRRNYSADWKGFGAITQLPMPAFKAWAKSNSTRKPLGVLPSTDVQNAPQPSGNPGQVAQAQAVEAPAPEGGDAAAATGIPATGSAGDVQADGVKLKDGAQIKISQQPAPKAFGSLVRGEFGEPTALIATNEAGEEVGRLTFMPNGGPIDSFVREQDRRRGVGTALYDALEARGGKLPPVSSGVAISDDARAFRKAREGTGESLTDRPDGTLSVKGDTKALRERLAAGGIPAKSILPSATGVVVGRTQAQKAREVLAQTLTAPTKSDIEAQQARAEQADKLDERAQVKRESEAGADSFTLTREDGRDGGTQPMFSRSAPLESQAFAKWFGDSKVVDGDGKPLRVFHGTPASFNAFKDGTGWFTADPGEANFWGGMKDEGANVMPAYLSIKNPRLIQASEASRDAIVDALSLLRGDQDGVLVMEDGRVRWAIVTEPTQIKSATGNQGTFDPENPDIRFAVDDAGKAGDTSTDGQPDTRPEARINIGLLGRDIAAYLGESRAKLDEVHPYVGRRIPQGEALGEIAQAFNAEIQGFGLRPGLTPAQEGHYGFFGGVRTSGVVFLRTEGNDRPHLAVLGHELAHELASKRPDLYKQLVQAINPYVNTARYRAEFVNSVVAKNVESAHKKTEEFIGEVLSDGFMDPDFWRALGRKNPSLLQHVGDFVFDMIDKAMKALGYTKRSAPYLIDYKAVMRIAGEVMAEYGVAPRGGRGDMAFQAIDPKDRTQTDTFRNWFGDSKVVDSTGRPLVVFHGTPDARFVNEDGIFATFKERMLKFGATPESKRDAKEGAGYFFTSSRSVAKSYADPKRAFDYQNSEEGVIPVFIALSNPLTFDAGGKHWREAQTEISKDDFIKRAKKAGHDGVIIKNVRDNYDSMRGGKDPVSDVFVAFKSEQIKHAEKNAGSFDPANPDIRLSRPLTAELFRQMTTPMQRGMKTADLQKAIAPVLKRWENGPNVTVVATTKDLPMPTPGDVHGVYFGGKVYLVAQNIRDKAKAMEVLTHEAIAHHGLREMLGKEDWKKFMGNIQLALKTGNKPLAAIRKDVRAAYVDEAGKFNLTEIQEADEIAAKVVEQAVDADGNFRPGFGFVKSVYAKVVEFLRSIGIDVKMTMAELQGALVNAHRFLEVGKKADGARKAREPVYMRSDAPSISTAIIGANLGTATSHPRYAAAKAGDVEAAVDVARALVTPELVDQVRAAIGGSKPVVVPVVSVEASGRNKIPLASAEVLAGNLGLETATEIVQSNSPKRTAMDGLDRIFASPEFDGPVVRGQDYVILDDTLTQGATFAALAAHIEAGGGRVVSAVALTGKQYSARIQPSSETLKSLREKHGDLESAFKAATGYGFDALTESEARYLANFKPAESVRDRIIAEGRSRGERQDPRTAGGVAFSRTAKAPASIEAEKIAGASKPAQAEMFQPGFWDAPQETRLDNIVYELQDGRIDLKRVQETIAKANTIPEKFDARLAETLYPGRVATRSERFLNDEAKPLLEAMARNNVTMDDLADYLHARHAEERNKQVAKVNPDLPDGGAGKNSKGVLMTNEAAKQHISALSEGKRMVLTAMAKRVDTITQGTTKLLVDEGLEKQETIDAWTGAYKSYVPLFRDEAENGNPHPTGSGMSVRGSSSKRAVGSTKKATNILAHVLMQREAAITRAEKNRVAVALYGLALTNPNPDFWTTIKPSMSPEAIGKELQRMGVDPTVAEAGMQGVPTIKTVDPTLGRVVSRPNPIYKSLPGAIVLKVNGEDRVLMLNTNDPRGLRMAENLKNLDGLTKFDIAGSAVGKTTRWMASVNTQYNPAFGLVNLTRDTLGGAINLSSTKLRGKTMKVLAMTPGALKGIGLELSGKNAGEWGRLFRQFQADGGQTGFKEQFKDANDRAKALESELKALEKAGQLTATKVAGKLLGALDIFNTTLENAVRLAAYREALQEGMSRPEAARLGRELTVDFNRKGRMGRELGPLYAFFNASVQGSARTLQTLAGPAGTKIIAGGVTLGVLQSVMLLAAGYDDDEVPEFVKARALVIPLGKDDEGKKRYFTIPLPLGLHVLPNTGRVLTELTLEGGKDIGSKSFAALGEIAGAFNPLGGGNIFTGSGFLRTVAPTIVDPIIETQSNENFAGSPIEREKYENDPRPGFNRARESTLRTPTGQTYTEISRIINTMTGGDEYEAGKASPSPEMVRYWAQVVGGGLLREIEKTVNTSIALAKGDDTKPTGFPVLGRFYGEVDDESVQKSRYYDNLAAIEKAEKMVKAAEKAGDLDTAQRIEEAKPEALLKKEKNRAQKDLRELNKEAMETVGDREAIKTIDAERTEVMRELNSYSREIDKPRRDGSLGGQLKKALGLADTSP